MNRSRSAAGLFVVATFGLTGGVTSAASSAVTGVQPSVFSYTGSAQSYTVPSDVCEVAVVARGAHGGAGVGEADANHPRSGAPGGKGGEARSTLAVTAGDVLQVNVGGIGGDGTYTFGPKAVPHAAGLGGWNGGGDGGYVVVEVDSGLVAVEGGGGGGASDVRRLGTGVADRVVVAGGGGGSGANSGDPQYDPQPVGGAGGNPATPGGDGTAPAPSAPSRVQVPAAVYSVLNATGGGAASASAGGAAGVGGQLGDVIAPDGAAGALAVGADGAGDTVPTDLFEPAGGGGGGLYGGGSGGASAVAGGAGAGGGGGSSLGSTTTAGVQSGNGQVTITPVADSCGGSTPTVPTSTPTTPVATPVATNPTYTG